jgi:hypothetical protein
MYEKQYDQDEDELTDDDIIEEEIAIKEAAGKAVNHKKALTAAKVLLGFIIASAIQLAIVGRIPSSVSNNDSFPAPHAIEESGLFVVLILGIAISFGQFIRRLSMMMGLKWRFAVNCLLWISGAVAFMISGLIFTTVVTHVQNELVGLEHTWVQQRYGITYDTISMESLGHERPDRQATFYRGNQWVADACPGPYTRVLLCESGTDVELPVIK